MSTRQITICAVCGHNIHALDGATTSADGPRHVDCDAAAAIDYPAAFDKLYRVSRKTSQIVVGLLNDTVGDDELAPYSDQLLTAWELLVTATAWRTYAVERGVTLPTAKRFS